MNSGAEGAENFLSIKIGQFFFTKYVANHDFSEPLIPKIPFSFFADFWVWVTSEARRSVSVGFWGSCQLSPFWGRGGSSQGALSTPPPPLNCKFGCPMRSECLHNRREGGGGSFEALANRSQPTHIGKGFLTETNEIFVKGPERTDTQARH